jgi:hypothetical protein
VLKRSFLVENGCLSKNDLSKLLGIVQLPGVDRDDRLGKDNGPPRGLGGRGGDGGGARSGRPAALPEGGRSLTAARNAGPQSGIQNGEATPSSW